MIGRRRKQALLGAKCVQAPNASKRPYNDLVATDDERAWSVCTLETKYLRSKNCELHSSVGVKCL